MEPTLPEALRAVMNARLLDTFTMLPGRIVAYDAATELATVKPLVKRRVGTGTDGFIDESLSEILEVPVQFPRGGSAFIKWKLKPGDSVALVFSMLDSSRFQDTGEEGTVTDETAHSSSHPIALPGWAPRGKTGPEVTGDEIVIESSEIHLGQGASELVALASLVKSSIEGAIQAHTHIDSVSGSTQGGLLPGGAADVAAQKVKAV